METAVTRNKDSYTIRKKCSISTCIIRNSHQNKICLVPLKKKRKKNKYISNELK